MKKLLLVAGLVISTYASAQATAVINGAGASFPAPVYAEWVTEYYQSTGIKINYQSIGSGAGINQIKAKTVDFGATDNPLTDAELAQENLIQFPTVIGGIVPIVNVEGIKAGELKLSGAVLAKIYLGSIKHWNDKQIQALNHSLKLPDAKINLVFRSDASGSTYVFTTYLAKVSQQWRDSVGAGSSIKWPAKGVAGKGNEGVAAFVGRLKNSIGYTEYAYASQNNLSSVSMQNSSGNFVQPNSDSFQAAVADYDWHKTFTQDTTNTANPQGWPIATTTFILVPKQAQYAKKNQQILKFFDWAYKNGDQTALKLDYAVFPESVKNTIRNSWQQLTDSDNQAIKYK